jgi:hypothetical protein
VVICTLIRFGISVKDTLPVIVVVEAAATTTLVEVAVVEITIVATGVEGVPTKTTTLDKVSVLVIFQELLDVKL